MKVSVTAVHIVLTGVAVPRQLFAAIHARIQWFGVPPPRVKSG